jgi:DNA polymerase-3 subunit epsilon
VVAHNARFDRAFLEEELARAGVEVAPLPTLCTMELAQRLAIGGVRRRLGDCRESLGLDPDGAHTALIDAEGAAAILACYLDRFASFDTFVMGRVLPREAWPADGPRAKPKLREPAFAQPFERSALTRLIAAAELPAGREGPDEAAYLEVLDRAIEDRHLDTAEGEELVALARTLGVDRGALDDLHRDYLNHLVALAHRDGEVTARERDDLYLVGEALGVEDLEACLDQDPGSTRASERQPRDYELAGRTVCFTGALTCQHDGEPLTRERAVALATAAGLTVLPRVTKKLDLLVLADPDSTSGKARQAREYGVRLIAETAFWAMIGVEVC